MALKMAFYIDLLSTYSDSYSYQTAHTPSFNSMHFVVSEQSYGENGIINATQLPPPHKIVANNTREFW